MFLTKKLRNRCNGLQPLLNCDELQTTLCSVETLGKQSLQYLSTQHNLNPHLESNTDSMKNAVIDHVTSGGCQALTSSLCVSFEDAYRNSDTGVHGDLETYILQLAARKVVLSKKTMQRILKSKGIKFNDSDNIGKLRQYL